MAAAGAQTELHRFNGGCPLPTLNSPSVRPVCSGNANVWIGADRQPPGSTQSGHSPAAD